MGITDLLQQIADSVRSKDGTTELIHAPDLPQRILDIPSGGSDSGLFYQEFASVNTIDVKNVGASIDLIVNDVEWLIMFPLQATSSAHYAISGGVYIPGMFGGLDRTGYGQTTFVTLGCTSGTEMTVSDGVLTLKKSNQTAYIYSDVKYGIVGKAKL